jgi:hypothetical protein
MSLLWSEICPVFVSYKHAAPTEQTQTSVLSHKKAQKAQKELFSLI